MRTRRHERMATRDKRIETMRRNPRQVRFADLKVALESLGFIGEPGKGDHWGFRHPELRRKVVVDARRPFLLAPYVRDALRAIQEVEAALEAKGVVSGEDGGA